MVYATSSHLFQKRIRERVCVDRKQQVQSNGDLDEEKLRSWYCSWNLFYKFEIIWNQKVKNICVKFRALQ